MGLFTKWGQTPADRILAGLMIILFIWLCVWNGSNWHKSHKQAKKNDADKVVFEKMKSNLLFLVEKQRASLGRIHETNYQKTDSSSKAPKELKAAIASLNKSAAEHNEMTNSYKKQYDIMLKDLIETIRDSEKK